VTRRSPAAMDSLNSAAGSTVHDDKASALYRALEEVSALIVAYSGGVDSAYLAYAATRVLGDRALCVTADSPSYPQRHRELATRIARDFSLNHEFIRTNEMARPEYRANAGDRCYHCKQELYSQLAALAGERGIPVIADGSNADDRGDYRPGPRVRRPQLPGRGGADEGGDQGALARSGPADMGRAGVRVPVVANPVLLGSHR
jgi:uncharacterized protein